MKSPLNDSSPFNDDVVQFTSPMKRSFDSIESKNIIDYFPPPSPQKSYQARNSKRIVVCCRKRPPTARDGQDCVAVDAINSGSLEITCQKMKLDGYTPYSETFPFQFDDVFDSSSTNSTIYAKIVTPLFDFITRPSCGGRATCFAYGQTGSGKTHTMFGSTDGEEGICFEALRNFIKITKQDKQCSLIISMFEIYQTQLYDLLGESELSRKQPSLMSNSLNSSPQSTKRKLMACEGGDGEVKIMGLTEVKILSERDGYSLIRRGIANRQIGKTGANSFSSRSHAIVQFSLKKGDIEFSRLSFIDLAGSERGADRKDVDRLTKMEGSEINKSLLALKECIRAMDNDKTHLPFRGSKLTLVLKDSIIGPNVMTSMIATVSPGLPSSDHSLNTLRYASRFMENHIMKESSTFVNSATRSPPPPPPPQQQQQEKSQIKLEDSEEYYDIPSSPLGGGPVRLDNNYYNLKSKKNNVIKGLDDIRNLIISCSDIDLICLLGDEIQNLKEAFNKLHK